MRFNPIVAAAAFLLAPNRVAVEVAGASANGFTVKLTLNIQDTGAQKERRRRKTIVRATVLHFA